MAKLKHSLLLASQSVAASVDSAAFNVADFGSLALIVNVGDFTFTGVNKVSLIVEHSDDNVTFVPVSTGDLYSAEDAANGVYKILDDVADKNKIYDIHYLGEKKYVQLALVVAGTVAAPISVNAIGGHGEFSPAL